MWMIPFLICFPFVVAVLMFSIRVNKVRNTVAYISAGTIMAVTGLFVLQWIAQGCQQMELYYHPGNSKRVRISVSNASIS